MSDLVRVGVGWRVFHDGLEHRGGAIVAMPSETTTHLLREGVLVPALAPDAA